MHFSILWLAIFIWQIPFQFSYPLFHLTVSLTRMGPSTRWTVDWCTLILCCPMWSVLPYFLYVSSFSPYHQIDKRRMCEMGGPVIRIYIYFPFNQAILDLSFAQVITSYFACVYYRRSVSFTKITKRCHISAGCVVYRRISQFLRVEEECALRLRRSIFLHSYCHWVVLLSPSYARLWGSISKE